MGRKAKTPRLKSFISPARPAACLCRAVVHPWRRASAVVTVTRERGVRQERGGAWCVSVAATFQSGLIKSERGRAAPATRTLGEARLHVLPLVL